ncbi:MAG: pyrroline-5-carboxylate reductase [Bacteroidetes bacterium]|nr:pyrroline-5-carboxylate reductase [Bacteroidota bacterium]
MKVLIIGFGNMGRTYARGFLASRFILPHDLYILDKVSQHTEARSIQVPEDQIHYTPGDFVTQADIIIMAVKPQDFPALAESVRPYIREHQVVLSVMAGVRIASIADSMGATRIVRSMPNLPAQVGMGMTVFTATPQMDMKELFIVQNLINTTGKSLHVEREEMLDAATAISGSGPAYVFYFMQSMIQTAVRMGFTDSEAELLVQQTFIGAVHLQSKGENTCSEWIQKVASRGGTTEAALKVFESEHTASGIHDALYAALNRAKELGN